MTSLSLVQISSRSQNADSFRNQFVENAPKIAAGNGIDTGRWFIQQNDFGPMNQCANQSELLLHASRKFSRQTGAKLAHPRGSQQFRSALVSLFPVHAKQVGIKADVLINRQILIQAESLRHVTEVMLGAFGIANHVGACDDRTTFVRRHDSGEHTQRRGLAGAIGTHQAEDFSGTNIEAEMIDRDHSWKALGESFCDDREMRLAGHYSPDPAPCAFAGTGSAASVICASAGMPGFSS